MALIKASCPKESFVSLVLMTEMGGAITALNTFWDITLVTALNGGELWGLHHLYIGVLKWTQNRPPTMEVPIPVAGSSCADL